MLNACEDKMTDKMINEDNIERFCAFCEKGTPIPSSERGGLVVCRKKGLVGGGYVCSAFRYDPLKREPKRKKNDAEYEVVNIDE